jgi:hypothetical protein
MKHAKVRHHDMQIKNSDQIKVPNRRRENQIASTDPQIKEKKDGFSSNK